MKTLRIITMGMLVLALGATPVMSQRNGSGGGGSRSGGSVSSSSSRSSGGGFSSSSRSSGGSSSRSSFSGSSSRSTSTPSRSSSSFSSRPSTSSPSHRNSGSVGSGSTRPSGSARNSGVGAPSSRPSSPVTGRHEAVRGREAGRTTPSSPRMGEGRNGGAPAGVASGRNGSARATAPAPTVNPGSQVVHPSGNYARPGRPGGYVPPAARPIHPAPYFHHPWHHHMVHCHPIFWDPLPPRPWYWPGFWLYCNSYWYDYHVTDVVVVHDYVEKTYHVDMVTYGISGDIMYAIVRDGGNTYLQVYDKDDHLLAEQKINRKYCNMVIDSENGGCWISKKNNKDALLFIWVPDEAKLLIYEAD